MTDSDRLQKAIELAAKAHAGQYRDNGEPFILHPMRVMMSVDTLEEKTIAILHDVVEDTGTTIENIKTILELREYDANKILHTLKLLTRYVDQGETYEQYIMVIVKNDKATKIKLADLKDNLNMLSYEKAGDLQVKRFKKHHRAYKELTR